jgi:hypothetical protein
MPLVVEQPPPLGMNTLLFMELQLLLDLMVQMLVEASGDKKQILVVLLVVTILE